MDAPLDSRSAYERSLFDRVGRWPAHRGWRELTVETLRQIAAAQGTDFATALLYDRIVHSPEHGPWVEQVQAPASETDGCDLEGTVALVPGACYVEYPHTGADGRRLRQVAERVGCRTEVVPVGSFGSLAENARTILDWLAQRRDGPVVLVSLSKGAADIKVALAQPGARQAFRRVAVWINLCGILAGTPLAGWFLRHPLHGLSVRLLCWYRGYDFAVFRDLDRRPGGPLDFALSVPRHLQVIHVVGFPLAGHLSGPQARRAYRRLLPWGPNDAGGILLGDLSRLSGLIYPVWGADHYMRPGWDLDPLVGRILCSVGRCVVSGEGS